jgi:hypothetical protein
VFAVHALGPLFDQYTAQLEKECDRYWKSGHQMCEVLSLTGNPCTNPLHRGGGEGAGGGESQGEANKLLEDADSSERFVTYQLRLQSVCFWYFIFKCNYFAAYLQPQTRHLYYPGMGCSVFVDRNLCPLFISH